MDLTIFIAVTAAAVLLQAGILLGMFLAVRKTSAKVEALADEIRTKVLPTAETVNALLIDLKPKIETAVENVSESTTMVRAQLQRMDATIGDLLDRSHLQVIRADDLVSRTLDKVEDATEIVHQSVVTPVRRIAGLVNGVTTAFEHLTGARRRGRGDAVPQDEMFI